MVSFPYQTECCGSYLAVSKPDLPERLSGDILASARRNGAQMIVTACPLCQFNLDKQQQEMPNYYAGYRRIPVFYFSQLMGSALGLDVKEYGWERHYVDPRPVIEKTGS